MGINALNGFIKTFNKAKSADRKIFMVLDSLASMKTRIKSPTFTFSGSNLNELPKPIQELTHGLKRPSLTLRFNGGNGQGIFGIRIKDGDEIVGNIALNMHKNRGKAPHIQTKFEYKANNKNAFSGSMSINPNGTKDGDFIDTFARHNGTYNIVHQRGDAKQISLSFNPARTKEFEQQTGRKLLSQSSFEDMSKNIANESDEMLNAIATRFQKTVKRAPRKTPKIEPKPLKDIKSNKTLEEAKELIVTNNVKTTNISKEIKAAKLKTERVKTARAPKVHKANTFADEVELIMKFEGRPTEASANKAKDILMRKMGYDPKLINVKVADDIHGGGGCYNIATGELLLDGSMAAKAGHFEVADCLVHELDHMDLAVKLAKKMGLDKFEKMILALTPKGETPPVFNRSFYEKAIQQADITDFNAKEFIDFEKRLIKLVLSNFSGPYLTKNNKYHYAISPMEIRARRKEIQLIQELQARGHKLSSQLKQIEEFGQQPSQHIVKTFPKVEAKLAKYPLAKRSEIYNEAYYKAMEDIHPEFARLERKLNTDALTESITYSDGRTKYIGETTRHFKLWEQLYGTKELAMRTEIELCERILKYIK